MNIEGLGRDLDPNLDLWTTAKPYLENWMSDQLGWHGLVRRLGKEIPTWAVLFPQFPRLLHHALSDNRTQMLEDKMNQLLIEKKASEPLAVCARIIVGDITTLAYVVIRIDLVNPLWRYLKFAI